MANMSTLTEGILLIVAFVILLTGVLAVFNVNYNKDYNVGLETKTFEDSFSNYITTANNATEGEVETTSDGLTLKSSWSMAKGLYTVLWDFISGQWINRIIIDMLGMEGDAGRSLALIIRMLFLASLIFSLVKLFFKVVA